MTPDQYQAQTRARIAANGHTYIGVFDPDGKKPTFAYSIGMVDHDLPEMLIIGNLSMGTLQYILNEIAQLWRNRGEAVLGDIPDVLGDGYNIRLVEVDPNVVLNGYAYQHKVFRPGSQPRFVQVMWPDTAHKFPNDDGYNREKYDQPAIEPV